MPALTNYGEAIAGATIGLRAVLASALPDLEVTARPLDTARGGVSGASVNLFLYREGLVNYREGNTPRGLSHMIAELHYLISVHPCDDADTNAASHRAHGTARAAIERLPVFSVPLTAGSMQVRLTSSVLPLDDLTSIWAASSARLRLAFGVRASFTLDAAERSAVVGTVRDVVVQAGAGAIAVFSGTDAVAKAAAAATVARELGKPLVTVPLGDIVSRYIVETERRLARLFDRAERGGAVLLIDEADALFGTRPAVRDNHDRYAEVEPGQVLDQFTRAPGVVIIAVRDSVGGELADRAAVEVRFPPHDA